MKLIMYDILGREISTLIDAFQDAGYKSIEFDGAGLPSGVYFYRLSAGSFKQVHKMLVLK